MAVEVLLLVLYQIAFGQLFLDLGVLVAAMMGGLSAGSLLRSRRGPVPYAYAAASLAIATGLVALVSALLPDRSLPVVPRQVLFLTLAAGVGVLGGRVFRAASWSGGRDTGTLASRLYSADLLGAAGGALLVATVLVPLVGISGVAWVAAGVSMISAVAIRLRGAKG
jgi:spermidine synthase